MVGHSLKQMMVSRKRTARMLKTSGTLPGNILQAVPKGRALELGGMQYGVAGCLVRAVQHTQVAPGPG